jgi:hypothetical protein
LATPTGRQFQRAASRGANYDHCALVTMPGTYQGSRAEREAARKQATLVDGHDVEIWHGSRKLIRPSHNK